MRKDRDAPWQDPIEKLHDHTDGDAYSRTSRVAIHRQPVYANKAMEHRQWLGFAGMAALSVCLVIAGQEAGKKPPAATTEFLSQARYLISKEERKELLSLPEEQQAAFIDEFWKKRDSDPATPTNEFKDEYFKRIRRANEMFTGEPQPGWLTDRGRIAIIYGEPTRRESPTPVAGQAGPCQETWYYDDFPVVFSDRACSGTFVLTTRDLDALRRRNFSAAARSRSLREPRRLPFDVEIHILKKAAQGNALEGLIRLDMPYSEIWYDFKAGNLQTTFAVEMELADSLKVVRWKFKDRFPVKLTAAEFKEKQKDRFQIQVPMQIESGVDELRAGRCQLSIIMENETSKERIRKVAEFSF